MSVSAVAPTPFYQDPERLQIDMPSSRAEGTQSSATETKHLPLFAEGDNSPSFWDVLDVINPLQHIPIVNDIYRDLTGDKIGVGARLVGGTLFGGVIGLAAAAANCAVEESTGTDMGGHMLALFRDDKTPAPSAPDLPATQLASAETPAAAQAQVAQAQVVPAQVLAAANAAPVIALPDTDTAVPTAAPAAQSMMFTLDGAMPVSAPVSTTPSAPVAAPAVAQVTAKPVGVPIRFMPAPNRNPNTDQKPLPVVTVPVANGSSRSNVPITGRAPNAAANAATSAAMQRALAGQDANHPMAPPTDASGQTAANPDWFSAAWGQALDKYERTNKLNAKQPTTVTLE